MLFTTAPSHAALQALAAAKSDCAVKGETLDERWVIVSEVPDVGGTAQVWRALDTREEHGAVAIKVIHSGNIGERTADLVWSREFSTLQRLSHPNILALLDIGSDPERAFRYFVLPWCHGTLEDALRDQPPSGWDDFYGSWGGPILRGLAHAHGRGVAHRDVKPKNVLLSAEGVPQIADFGIARLVEDVAIGPTVRDWKSPPYTPRNHTPREAELTVDVFSFGVLCALALEPQSEKLEPYARLDAAMAALDVPAEIDAVLRRCVSEDPGERYPSAETLLDDVEAIERRRSQSAERLGLGPPMPVVPLQLSQKAESKLLNLLDLQTELQLEDLILGDLSDAYAFVYDPPRPDHGRSSLRLLGSELVLRIGINERRDAFRVIDGYPSSSAELERQREHGYAPRVSFSFEKSRSGSETAELLERLSVESEEHHQERVHQRQVDARARPFKVWRRTLIALRAIEKSREAPLDYLRFRPGAVTVFEVGSSPSEDLVGETRTAQLVGGRALTGEVVAVDGESVSLRVSEGDPSDLPGRGILRLDTRAATSALRRQERALDAVEFGTSLRPNLGDLMLDPSDARPPTQVVVANWFGEALDSPKRDAVVAALGTEDLLVVEGPPGTGKTTFISELIRQELQAGKRILLASQTNAALDNVLERLSESDPALRLLRVARPDDPKVASAVEHLRLDRQLRKWKREAVRSGTQWLAAWATANGFSVRDVEVAMRLEELAMEIGRAGALQGEVDDLDTRVETAGAQQAVATGATEADAIQTLRGQRSQARRELEQCRRDARELAERLSQLGELEKNSRIDDLDAETLELRAMEITDGIATDPGDCQKLIRLLAEWHARFGVGPEFEAATLLRAQVVAATCVGLGGIRGIESIDFDTCIIDEASKATATELFIPMSRASRWILVGDSRQLPPYVDEALRSQSVLHDHGLGREEVEETLFARLRALLPAPCQRALTHQHRMHPSIGNLISECFYRGELTSEPRARPKWLGLALPAAVTWFTTTPLNDRSERFSGGSFSNPCEAREIFRFLHRLNFAAKANSADLTVAVLSAYTGQRDALERSLTDQLRDLAQLTVECSTVDAFQGREADVAIYSATRSNPDSKIGFLKEASRANVALSRGKGALVIFGDHAFCRVVPGSNPLRGVLEYIEAHEDCALVALEDG